MTIKPRGMTLTMNVATCFAMIFCTSLPCFSQENTSQRFAGQQKSTQQTFVNRSRMSVVEVQPQSLPAADAAEMKSHITIVGAVKRSGVYETSGPTVCLKDLIEAAGGMTEKASPSIRIIRGGYLRTQLYYSERCTNDLKPGDIVVVVSQPAAFSDVIVKSDLIPVACVGLDQRPIVLPLDPSIATVQDLSQRLLQSRELADTAVVLDPLGRRLQSALVPGSIVFFNPNQLDLPALDQVKQKQPFPKLMPMSPPAPQAEQELEAVIPPVTAMLQVNNYPVPEMSTYATPQHEEVLPTTTMQSDSTEPATQQSLLAPTPIFNAPISVVTVEPLQTSLQTPQAPQVEVAQQVPTELQLPVIPNFQQASVTENDNTSMSSVNEDSSSNQSISYETRGSNDANYSQKPTLAEPTPVAPSSPKPTLADEEPVEEIMSAPLPPVEEVVVASPSLKSIAFAGLEESEKSPTRSSQSWIPVTLGVGLLAVLCLGVSLLWSRYDHQQTRNMFVQHNSHAENESTSHTPKSEIEAILDNSLQMIEEQVLIPEKISLHGEPVGHRRIIVNEEHSELHGPHFARKPKQRQHESVMVAARYDERELRNNLREAIKARPSTSLPIKEKVELDIADEVESATLPPHINGSERSPSPNNVTESLHQSVLMSEHVATKPDELNRPHTTRRPAVLQDSAPQDTVRQESIRYDTPRYDIVQPESYRGETVGPLERALNAISKEKAAKENL